MTPAASDPAAVRARTDALLDARAAALAARRTLRERPVETVAYLVCACGPERFGLPLPAVAGVSPERPCTALPGAAPALRGIAAVAGAIVSVLDLAACLGLDGTGPEPGAGHTGFEPGTGHVVRLRAQDPPVALAVERVLGIARIDAALARAEPEVLGGRIVLGYAPPGSDLAGEVRDGFSILDLPALLARVLT